MRSADSIPDVREVIVRELETVEQRAAYLLHRIARARADHDPPYLHQ